MRKVFLYQDYVHKNEALYQRLKDSCDINQVERCDASQIKDGCLDVANVLMLVMPGGADLHYVSQLNGNGNKAIRSYVEEGGTYLGICAGAYYACSRVEWAKDDPAYEICGPRELSFFQGTAQGPLYSLLEDNDIGRSWDNVAKLSTYAGKSAAMYSAGPVFIPDKWAAFTPLASFYEIEGQPLAIIETEVGKGRAILCSPHIEFTPAMVTPASLAENRVRNCQSSPIWSQSVCDKFAREWSADSDFWTHYILPILSHRFMETV